MADSREEILKFLGDIQSFYGIYHNHKETSAWAGLVLYVLLLAQLINAVDRGMTVSCEMKAATTILILVSGIVIWIYLRAQFSARQSGSNLFAASVLLRSQYVSHEKEVQISDFSPQSSAEEKQSSHILPRIVLTTADELASKGGKVRKTLECCAYALVVVVGFLALARVWIVVAA